MATRLERLEMARWKLGLSNIEEVEEQAVDFYLQVIESRESNRSPTLKKVSVPREVLGGRIIAIV